MSPKQVSAKRIVANHQKEKVISLENVTYPTLSLFLSLHDGHL